MQHRPVRILYTAAHCATLALSLHACRCDDESPKRKAEAHARPALQGEANNEGAPEPPLPSGTPLGGDVLLAALPMTFGQATAEGESSAQDTPLSNGGLVPVAKRSYRKGELSIQVQLSDTLHAPAFKSMLEKQEGKSQSGKETSWKGITIGAASGVAMHQKRQDMALVRVMLDDRILLTVQVQPAQSPDIAVEIAQQLPMDQLLKLVPTQGAPGPTVP
jgi:hypothetical protein